MKKDKDNIINVIDEIFAEDGNYVNLNEVDNSVKDWVDTGNYALNFVISNSFFGGYPCGRVTTIEGLKSTGKSMLLGSALRDPSVEMGIVFESEGGGFSREILNFMGVDVSKVRQKKIRSYDCFKVDKSGNIEAIKDAEYSPDNKLHESGLIWNTQKVLDILVQNKPKGKFILGVDSLANISSAKELSGSLDMGKRNQLSNKFFRIFDSAFDKFNVACILTNKMYTDIGAGEYEEKYISAGGVSVEYNSSVIVRLENVAISNYLSADEIKTEKENMKTSRGASVVAIQVKINKSRFGTYGRRAILLLDFNKGLIRNSGVFNIAKEYDLLDAAGAWYSFKNKDIYANKFYRKDFDEILNDDMLRKMETEIKTKRTQIEETVKEKAEEVLEVETTVDNLVEAVTKDL